MLRRPSATAVRRSGSMVSSPGKPGGGVSRSFSSTLWGAGKQSAMQSRKTETKAGSGGSSSSIWPQRECQLLCASSLWGMKTQMMHCLVWHHCHATILPSTGHQSNITVQSKAGKHPTPHFSPFKCCGKFWNKPLFQATTLMLFCSLKKKGLPWKN